MKVKVLRTSVKDKKPTTTGAAPQLDYGDLAVNFHAESPALFLRANDDTLIEFHPGSDVAIGAAAPVVRPAGQLWFDTGAGRLMAWKVTGTGGARTGAWEAVAPPVALSAGRVALTLNGSVDATAAPAVGQVSAAGDVRLNTGTGVADAGYAGLAGQAVSAGQWMVFDGASWAVFGGATPAKPDWNAAAGTEGEILNKPALPGAASATAAGLVELATNAEAQAGTDAARAVTPAGLKSALPGAASEAAAGLIQLATEAEAKAGTDALKAITPATLKAALPAAGAAVGAASETAAGTVELATTAEALAGTDAVRAVTPAGLKATLDGRPAGLIYAGGVNIVSPPPAGAKADELYTVIRGGAPHAGFGGLTGTLEIGDLVRCTGPAWERVAYGGVLAATDAAAGVVELATPAEVQALSDSTRAVTPAGLAGLFKSSIRHVDEVHKIVDFKTTSSAWQDIGVLLSVTPQDANSRLLLLYSVPFGQLLYNLRTGVAAKDYIGFSCDIGLFVANQQLSGSTGGWNYMMLEWGSVIVNKTGNAFGGVYSNACVIPAGNTQQRSYRLRAKGYQEPGIWTATPGQIQVGFNECEVSLICLEISA